ncbi:MAG: GNAT family N-acetyltransferase [Planctomycetes bacterium]|nr:GNAT family N-acetyltransferase [Planctomycetota bacterium]
MQVETLDIRTLPNAQATEIAELLVSVWPKSVKTVAVRHEQLLALGDHYAGLEAQAPRSLFIRENGQIIAHAAVLPRTIGTAAGDMVIAGLTRVCTAPEQRGRGLGEIVVRAVFELVDDGTFPFSLFQTTLEVRPFYEKLGATIIENPIINSLEKDAHGSPFWDKEIMRYPGSGNWPGGEIDLRGPGY